MYDELINRMREFASLPEHCENVADCDQCPKEDICIIYANKQVFEVLSQAVDVFEELQGWNSALRESVALLTKQLAELGKESARWQEEAKDWYLAYMNLLPTRWIPVTEALPDEDGFTLIFTAHGHAGVCYFTSGWWGGYDKDGITHWQPLPEPPTAEEGE